MTFKNIFLKIEDAKFINLFPRLVEEKKCVDLDPSIVLKMKIIP